MNDSVRHLSLDYSPTTEYLAKRASILSAYSGNAADQLKDLRLAVSLIDLTTLEGSDTEERVTALCAKAEENGTAAVCVYPSLVETAKRELASSSVRVACVAGGFPHGQTSLRSRIASVEDAAEAGADEIDIVFSRKLLLEGAYESALEEIFAMRAACEGLTLKVILETGELKDPVLIRKAALIAIDGGADFIKTSTGKIADVATLPDTLNMIEVIKAHHEVSDEEIGMKPAGGIKSAGDALAYVQLVRNVLGEHWIDSQRFRFGASSLLDSVCSAIRSLESGRSVDLLDTSSTGY